MSDTDSAGSEQHLNILEIRNKHGTHRETELNCPETGQRSGGEMESWNFCPWCGAELGEPEGVRVEDYTTRGSREASNDE